MPYTQPQSQTVPNQLTMYLIYCLFLIVCFLNKIGLFLLFLLHSIKTLLLSLYIQIYFFFAAKIVVYGENQNGGWGYSSHPELKARFGLNKENIEMLLVNDQGKVEKVNKVLDY